MTWNEQASSDEMRRVFFGVWIRSCEKCDFARRANNATQHPQEGRSARSLRVRRLNHPQVVKHLTNEVSTDRTESGLSHEQ
jgi:hypothetical protein